MKKQNRRGFFKMVGGISAGLVALKTSSAKAGAKNILSVYRMGTLVPRVVFHKECDNKLPESE